MTSSFWTSGCARCRMSRRNFLAGCVACAGGTTGLWAAQDEERGSEIRAAKDRMRIRIVHSLHSERQSVPDWPNVGYDFRPAMDRIAAGLREGCPELEFVSSTATGEDQARAILEEDRDGTIEGYVVCQMNCWNRVVQTLAASGKPVLYTDFKYGGSGGFLTYTAAFLRSGASNVGFVASSDLEDLLEAARCFTKLKRDAAGDFATLTKRVRVARTREMGSRVAMPDAVRTLPIKECVERMRESKILAVRSQESGPANSIMGIPVVNVAFAELNEAWETADRDESVAVADRWERDAARVSDVTRETLEQSAAMYLAQKAVMKRHGACAITINCLGGFYGGHIHAYPCLGFHQLLNEGLVGACECDVRSTATMVALTTLTMGRPGYISDPVIDTSKRQIIYAHCVASNRAFGPEGRRNAFEILTHSEDRQGASVRSVLPLGYLTTTLQVSQERKEILFHRARAVSNDRDDRACRTKLAAEPLGDLERLFGEWDQWGWHRVTYYGDLKEPVQALVDALGWRVVSEA